MEEVRFDRMVPSIVVARRTKCNLAYLPVGTLEWHGPHMPFGTDCFTVTYIAEEAARRYGGVVFPPITYGDVRYLLHECRVEWRKTYTQEMDVPETYARAFPLQNNDGSPGYECPPSLMTENPPKPRYRSAGKNRRGTSSTILQRRCWRFTSTASETSS